MPASEWVSTFEQDWPAVQEFLAALPHDTVGAELSLRVELEQYGRRENERFRLAYPEVERTRLWAPIAAADRNNTQRVRELLADRNWFNDEVDGIGAQRSAWLIVQHADHAPGFQRQVLDRLQMEVGQGRIQSSEYAMLWDRVSVHEGRPQRYGSQLSCIGGELAPIGGVEDPQNLDTRRMASGLPVWSEYRATMDRLRPPCPRP